MFKSVLLFALAAGALAQESSSSASSETIYGGVGCVGSNDEITKLCCPASYLQTTNSTNARLECIVPEGDSAGPLPVLDCIKKNNPNATAGDRSGVVCDAVSDTYLAENGMTLPARAGQTSAGSVSAAGSASATASGSSGSAAAPTGKSSAARTAFPVLGVAAMAMAMAALL